MSTPCAICPDLPCEFPSDLDLYSLDGLQYFLNGEYFFVLDCPPGYDCYNWPVNWRIPPGRLPPITPPPRRPGTTYDFTLRLKCCGSDVVGTVHVVSTMTTDQYNAELKRVVDAMFYQCARLQAECEAKDQLDPTPPPPPPTPSNPSLQFKISGLAPNVCCINTSFVGSITVVTAFPSATFSLIDGALPSGLTMKVVSPKGVIISGTPTTPGTSTFTVQVVYGTWSNQKTFSIGVLGISNASTLTNAQVGIAYSDTLTAVGGTGPYTYEPGITAGPAWLSIATDGTLSGTPTSGDLGVNDFDVIVTDSAGRTCTQTCSITVAFACADWTQLAWQVASQTNGTFSPSSSSSDSFSATVLAGVSNVGNQGLVTYNGPGCNCNIHLVYAGGVLPGTGNCVVSVMQVAPFIALCCWVGFTPRATGTYDVPFSLPNTGGVPLQYRVLVSFTTGSGPLTLSGTVSNI